MKQALVLCDYGPLQAVYSKPVIDVAAHVARECVRNNSSNEHLVRPVRFLGPQDRTGTFESSSSILGLAGKEVCRSLAAPTLDCGWTPQEVVPVIAARCQDFRAGVEGIARAAAADAWAGVLQTFGQMAEVVETLHASLTTAELPPHFSSTIGEHFEALCATLTGILVSDHDCLRLNMMHRGARLLSTVVLLKGEIANKVPLHAEDVLELHTDFGDRTLIARNSFLEIGQTIY